MVYLTSTVIYWQLVMTMPSEVCMTPKLEPHLDQGVVPLGNYNRLLNILRSIVHATSSNYWTEKTAASDPFSTKTLNLSSLYHWMVEEKTPKDTRVSVLRIQVLSLAIIISVANIVTDQCHRTFLYTDIVAPRRNMGGYRLFSWGIYTSSPAGSYMWSTTLPIMRLMHGKSQT